MDPWWRRRCGAFITHRKLVSRLQCGEAARFAPRGASDGTRTHNPRITSAVRYQLRHRGLNQTRFATSLPDSQGLKLRRED